MLSGSSAASGNPERVVLFHDFSQALGGASYLVQVLIEQLRARDVPVTFFAGDDGANFHRNDVEFVPLHGKALLARSKLGALTVGMYNETARARIQQWINKNDTPRTIYHLHGWSKVLTPSVFAPLKTVRERLILHGHDYFNCCPNGAFFNYVTEADCRLKPLSGGCLRTQCDKSSYLEKLWRSAREQLRRGLGGGTTNASRILLIHPRQAGSFALGEWPEEKMIPLRNPVTPPCADRVRAEDNRGVVFIGRISQEKGADLAALAAKKAGVPITFVGDGSELENIRKLNDQAVFLGRQDRSGVAKALSHARIALMPSRWSEPFGLVALEAVGSGVPVIVNNRALIADEIAESGFGLAIDTVDIDAFAKVISDLHGDDQAVLRMSLAGRERYRDICNSEESWTDEIMENYRETVAAATGEGAPIPAHS